MPLTCACGLVNLVLARFAVWSKHSLVTRACVQNAAVTIWQGLVTTSYILCSDVNEHAWCSEESGGISCSIFSTLAALGKCY